MQVFNIAITAQEGDLIIGALANMPYGQVSALIANLQGQAQGQMQAQAAEEAPEAVDAAEPVGGTD